MASSASTFDFSTKLTRQSGRMVMTPAIAIVLAGNALYSGIRALELWALYDGDELMRDRDDWKYR